MKPYFSLARDAVRLRICPPRGLSDRRMWIKGTAGLCNRLWFLLYAAAYAERYRWRLSVDWRDGMYGPRDVNAFERLFQFDLSVPLPSSDEVSGFADDATIYPDYWRHRTDLSAISASCELRDRFGRPVDLSKLMWPLRRALIDAPPQTRVMIATGYAADAWDMRASGLSVNLRSIATRLKPSPRCADAIDTAIAPGLRCIGVHVRRTDAPNQVPLEHYLSAIPGDERRVFLCTDDADVERQFRSVLGSRLLPVERTYLAKGQALHYHAEPQSRELMAIEAIRDLYALARCETIVHGLNSSFSKFATRVLANPGVTVRVADRRFGKLRRSFGRRVETFRNLVQPNQRRATRPAV